MFDDSISVVDQSGHAALADGAAGLSTHHRGGGALVCVQLGT